jgi:hypothetical protein
MGKALPYILVGAAFLAIGVGIGLFAAKSSSDPPNANAKNQASPAGQFSDTEIKDAVIVRLLKHFKELPKDSGRSEWDQSNVSFAFQSIDRRSDGLVVVTGLLRAWDKESRNKFERTLTIDRFWVELVPERDAKKWKDIQFSVDHNAGR